MTAVTAVSILTSPIAAGLATYLIVAMIALIAARQTREEMVDLGIDLLNDPFWTDEQRSEISLLMDTCASFRVGLLLPLAVVSVVLDEILDRDVVETGGQSELMNDSTFQSFFMRYVISIAAANPIAAIVSVVLVVLGWFVTFALGRNVRNFIEEPVFRASASLQRDLELA